MSGFYASAQSLTTAVDPDKFEQELGCAVPEYDQRKAKPSSKS